nr:MULTISPECIES: AEC family transporter [unclassified Acinetobacter]
MSILFPICTVVLLGYFAIRSQFIETSAIQFLGQFVMKVALPAFLLQALASKSLSEIWHPAYFLGYGGGSILLFIFAFLLYRHYFNSNLTHASVLAMGASMSNTGFIGTAILTLLIGSQSAIYLSLTLIVENLIIVAIMLILAERGLQSTTKPGWQLYLETLQRLLKNPVILSILLGMLCVLLNFKLPQAIAQVLEMLGKTASPLALFVIGGSLVGMQIKSVNLQSIVLVAFKVLLMPLTIFGILWALDVNREMLFVGTLLAALPMPIAFGIFGQHYGLHEKALAPLVLSTVFGFVMVAILLTQSGKYF